MRNPLDRLEAAMERMVEGNAGRLFRARLEPAEIGRRLERAMAAGTALGINGQVAPNALRAALHPADFAPFANAAPALAGEFANWLEGVAGERGWTLLGPVSVELVADPAVPRREVRVRAEMAGDGAGAVRRPAVNPGRGPVRLLIASGPQVGQEVLATRPSATVGRGPECDVVLLDPSVSRRHARIDADDRVVRVTDLGSTNGTWRNGVRVREDRVLPGDEIRFGAVAVRVLPWGKE